MFKIGILGAGHIAEKMAATLDKMENAQAFAVGSRDLAKAEAFASKFGVTKAYGSYQELADDPEVELIYVATPHTFHYPHVKMCLEKGKPVLCEKAFMANAREAREVISISEEKGVFLSEAIWTRYLPFSKTIKEIAGSGAIGKPVMLTAHLGYPVSHKERLMRPELGGGALLDLGVYTLNFALMYFGNDICEISSSCIKAETGVDIQETITLKYSDGKVAGLMATALCANDRQGIINGDSGYIIVDNINNPLRADLYAKDHTLIKTYTAPEQITGFEYQVQACIDAINAGKTETEFMPHKESIRVMELMDGLREKWGVIFPQDQTDLIFRDF